MSLTLELILRDEVKKLLDHFASVLNIQTVFFSADGVILKRGRHLTNCLFCQMVQRHLGGSEKCFALDRRKQQEAAAAKRAVCYHCHAGLREVMAPVFIDGQLAGYISFGQFRTEETPPIISEDQELQSQLAAEFMSRPFFSGEALADLVGMFDMLLDYIVTRELVAWHGDRIWEQVRNAIENGLDYNLKLSDIARRSGRSVSTVSHLIKARTGLSFKELWNEKRLEKAESMMKAHPEMSIGEIAAATGFSDRYYFSRLYAKKRGCPPSATRRKFSGS